MLNTTRPSGCHQSFIPRFERARSSLDVKCIHAESILRMVRPYVNTHQLPRNCVECFHTQCVLSRVELRLNPFGIHSQTHTHIGTWTPIPNWVLLCVYIIDKYSACIERIAVQKLGSNKKTYRLIFGIRKSIFYHMSLCALKLPSGLHPDRIGINYIKLVITRPRRIV